MFLTAPTIQELQTLELPALLDMLVNQTSTYTQLESRDGLTEQTLACRDMINTIQAAIKIKVDQEKIKRESVSFHPLPESSHSAGLAN